MAYDESNVDPSPLGGVGSLPERRAPDPGCGWALRNGRFYEKDRGREMVSVESLAKGMEDPPGVTLNSGVIQN